MTLQMRDRVVGKGGGQVNLCEQKQIELGRV